jgi:hypothetical protein
MTNDQGARTKKPSGFDPRLSGIGHWELVIGHFPLWEGLSEAVWVVARAGFPGGVG